MSRFIASFVLSLFVINSYTQTIQVRDRVTHQPLELVTIFSQEPQVNTITNMKGQSNLHEFKGLNHIIFRLIGYETIHFSYEELERQGFLVFMDQTELSLNEVVVSATRWKQGQRETPAKISVLKPKELNFLNPQTAADLVEMTGDVYVQKSQMGGGSPMIRGFATNRVLITIDGVRMNNAIFRSGNIQNIISLDPFATNRAEVIFGPGSLIYGSDAIGGVMGFYTFEPILSNEEKSIFKANALTRYSSANTEKTGHVDLNFGYKKWAALTSISYSDYGDLKMGSHGPEEYLRPEYLTRVNDKDVTIKNDDPKKQRPSAYNQLNLMQKFKYMPNDDWQFNYGFHYSESSNVPRYDRLVQYNDDNELKNGDWYYGPQKWMMNNLNIQHSANSPYYNHLQIVLAHQFFQESRHSRKIHKEDIKRRTEKVNALSFNLDFEKNWNGDRLFYGLEFIGNKIGSDGLKENLMNGAVTDAASRYADGSTWLSAAIYTSYLKRLSEKTNLQTGLRYNFIYVHADFDNSFYDFAFDQTEINNGALTGSLGIIYNPTEKWQLSSSISSGFRAPNIDDISKVFDSEPEDVVVPNPDLKPEYAINGELGAAVVLVRKWKVDMAVYYTYLIDAMVRRPFQFNGQDSIVYDEILSQVHAVQNASSAYVYGIQTGVEYKWKNGFSASSRFNYQHGKEKNEDGTYAPLRHAAPWFGTTHISYEKKKIKIDLSAKYNGEIAFEDMPDTEISKAHMYASDTNGNPYSPGWTTFNLKTQYAITPNTLFTAGVDNITDERYQTYSSGIAAPGRNYIVSLRLSL